ncbi:MAG: hypothetical protein KDH15_06880 [Rhodocyclaceae bacterium]|nr:hypothetical protein [Rhodocyclaceae bacterium]
MHQSVRPLAATLVAASAFFAGSTQASCGAAFCSVNTTSGMIDLPAEGQTRVDLRFEFIDQNQPRSGSRDVAVGEISAHHDEVRTINRNLLATVDHVFVGGWQLGLTLPVVDRSHTHIHNHHHEGAVLHLNDHWDFTEIGDLRVDVLRALVRDHHQQVAVRLGVKLPTGSTTVTNDDGDEAERSLQPGSGTTDLVLGGYWRRVLQGGGAASIGMAAQFATGEHDDYRPGHRLQFDLGYEHPLTPRLTLPVQLNVLLKARDQGEEAEPEDSGLQTIALSPGLSFEAGGGLRLYGFYQRPLYQHVHGVQLTAHWSAVLGASYTF